MNPLNSDDQESNVTLLWVMEVLLSFESRLKIKGISVTIKRSPRPGLYTYNSDVWTVEFGEPAVELQGRHDRHQMPAR